MKEQTNNGVVLAGLIFAVVVILVLQSVDNYRNNQFKEDSASLTMKEIPYITRAEKEQYIVDAKNYVYRNKDYLCRKREGTIYTNGKYVKTMYQPNDAVYRVINPDKTVIFEQYLECQ